MKLWSWRVGHCPTLFPLVSTPPVVRINSRRDSLSSSTLLRSKPTRVSPIIHAFKGIPGLNLFAKNCKKCNNEGAIECPSCKGTGKNKKNGNVFERWKCYDCQGFGMMTCPGCGKGGLTPEQRRER